MQLNFPTYIFDVIEREGKTQIFDNIRKKYVALTPEEWVRQHVIKYLAEQQIPLSLISVEREIKVNTLRKRFDILVYNNNAKPCMLIECKAPEVKLTQHVLNQIALYNSQFNVAYLYISNGLQHIVCKFDYSKKKYIAIKIFPTWVALCEE